MRSRMSSRRSSTTVTRSGWKRMQSNLMADKSSGMLTNLFYLKTKYTQTYRYINRKKQKGTMKTFDANSYTHTGIQDIFNNHGLMVYDIPHGR